MNRIFLLCLTLVLMAGCVVKNQPPPLPLLHIHTNATETGEFWVSFNGGEAFRLLHDAQGYRPLISPDGAWLAVEVRLMSDLEVVRLFRRDGDRFVTTGTDVTAIAWRQVAAAKKIKLEDLDNATARVSGWNSDGTHLQLELSALEPGEPELIETVVSIPLDHER